MPKRTDIHKILIIGSGPIIISQGCEFDYSGTQACKALKEEGYQVILINSNPATIMTDPEFADKTYIEPIIPQIIDKILEKEKPDAILPTEGGQTALNAVLELDSLGILKKHNVELIGASIEVIKKAESRELFKKSMERIGLKLPKSGFAYSLNDALKVIGEIGSYPVVIRPSYTLGGVGGGIANNEQELLEICRRGLDYSIRNEVLIEQSLIGWKEFELEVIRDKNDNVIIVCSIENLDPMGIHTGDSITVAPSQTLTDKEYQNLRDASIAVMREIGVETGGSNIQFAVNPKDGDVRVIEMNPRVSRSSALASKATGFPIAKVAAKLAVGYTLDEISNDITKKTCAAFEPTIDYVVVKYPRWAFEKFPQADPTLTTQMKSVGETMAIGRTFQEAFQKAIRSLEIGRYGWIYKPSEKDGISDEILESKLRIPTPERLFYLKIAFEKSVPLIILHEWTRIDPWFLNEMKEIFDSEKALYSISNTTGIEMLPDETFFQAKKSGFSDEHLASIFKTDEVTVRKNRIQRNITPVYKLVDTCAAEFEALTPYYYSSYEESSETRSSNKEKIMILGGGPNRIGQGIEFDYCCVHASFALREMGYESIMVNSNPETVSTDFDISDKLFFEPVTFEDVMNIYEAEKCDGVIVQLGGQTPLNIALRLKNHGVKIWGTPPEMIDLASDRKKFQNLCRKIYIRQPANATAMSMEEALEAVKKIGFPTIVRPSFVLGGRAMEIVYDEKSFITYMEKALLVSPEYPVLIDEFIEDAIELEVDAVSDGQTTVIGGILEHIEEAGIHSGDSASVIPTFSINDDILDEIRRITFDLAKELNVKGLMNVQFAFKNDQLFIIEVNPRASRTVPFISKSIGVSLARLATFVMAGKKLKDLGFTKEILPKYYCVKEAVLPFSRFPGSDILLGPEMRSTGEVMGFAKTFGEAFIKAEFGAGQDIKPKGKIFISVQNKDKRTVMPIAVQLHELGYQLCATKGTANVLRSAGLNPQELCKLKESGDNIMNLIEKGEIVLVINTPKGKVSREDERKIRSLASIRKIPCITTMAGAQATVTGLSHYLKNRLDVLPLQEYHKI
ncbi:MAG: carbamoyl-phosphate synthase large subunit [Candidatus Aureabacteria bacterium]|nr:carbamoyl-phosphate synthase large subunit [Candidatus Auribacterota bacterium]